MINIQNLSNEQFVKAVMFLPEIEARKDLLQRGTPEQRAGFRGYLQSGITELQEVLVMAQNV